MRYVGMNSPIFRGPHWKGIFDAASGGGGEAPVDPVDPINPVAGTLRNPSLSTTLNWSSQWGANYNPFYDWMKVAVPWHDYAGMSFGDLVAGGHVTRSGEVISIPEGNPNFGVFALCGLPALPEYSGQWELSWEGTADVSFSGVSGSNTWEFPNKALFTFNPDGSETSRVHIRFSNITAGPIRNVKLYKAEDIPAVEAGGFFRASWLELIRNMRILRFKDWQVVDNYTGPTAWANRPMPDWTFYGADHQGGVPAEVMIDLCNLIGADPWFVMPHTVSDDYVAGFADLAKQRLRPEQHAYVEYTNKWWDGVLSQHGYCQSQGESLFGTNNGSEFAEWYAGRASQVCDLWRSSWTGSDADRLHTVYQCFTDSLGVEGYMLDASRWMALGNHAPKTSFDTYAVHGNVDGGIRYEDTAGQWNTIVQAQDQATLNATIAGQLRSSATVPDAGRVISVFQTRWSHHKAVCDAEGYDLVMYEGGSHIGIPYAYQNDAVWREKLTAFHKSQAWADVYGELIAAYYAAGGTNFMAVAEIQKHSWTYFGMLEYLEDTSLQRDVFTAYNQNHEGSSGRGDAFIGSREVTPP